MAISTLENSGAQEYARLWASVIIQALIDATATNTTPEETVAKQQAHAWFVATSGEAARDFIDVCLAANFEPEIVRNFYTNYSGPPLTMHELARRRNQIFKTLNAEN